MEGVRSQRVSMVTQNGANRRCNKIVVCACSTRTADTTLPHVTLQVLEFTSDLLVCITDMCPCQISPSVHQNQRGNKIFIRARSARTADTTLPPIAARVHDEAPVDGSKCVRARCRPSPKKKCRAGSRKRARHSRAVEPGVSRKKNHALACMQLG